MLDFELHFSVKNTIRLKCFNNNSQIIAQTLSQRTKSYITKNKKLFTI